MLRKLIYVSGLLACFQCHLDHSAERLPAIRGSLDGKQQVIGYFERVFQNTPLDIVSGILLKVPAPGWSGNGHLRLV